MKSKKKKITLLKMFFEYDESEVNDLEKCDKLPISIKYPKVDKMSNLPMPLTLHIKLVKSQIEIIRTFDELFRKEGYGDE